LTLRLTTVRQPLREMGQIAAKHLLDRIDNGNGESSRSISMQPEIVIRESTGPCLTR
jgi:LacI family transcriptional regulator